MKFTRHSLGRLEDILAASGYVVRYEKGNFASSSCRLFDNRVVVVNKFLNVEQRNLVLIDFILNSELNKEHWKEKQIKWVEKLEKWKDK